MKVRDLQLGDQIKATVEEVLPEAALIVSVEGELFRVLNDTGLQLKSKDTLKMTVVNLNPTLFRLQKYDQKKIDRFA